MAKKRTTGIYLGTTRRQKNTLLRNLSIIAVLVALTVVLSAFFVSWLLENENGFPHFSFWGQNEVQTDPAETDDSEVTDTQDTACITDRAEDTSDTEPAGDTSTEVTAEEIPPESAPEENMVEIVGTPYKVLDYTDQWVVMLDAGHGFDDIGTASQLLGETNEATVNLDIALRAQRFLESMGVTVIMTHDTNAVDGRISAADGGEPPLRNLVLLTPQDRADLANGQDIDLFVSIHCDSIPDNPNVSGMRIYLHQNDTMTKERNSATMALATNIANAFGLMMGDSAPKPLVKDMTEDQAYYVIREIGVPSVLCEVGFVTNQTDAANMLDPAWREDAAKGIVDGVIAYIRSADLG
ncbi:MAG: N-acetylmuramoyl-L-alanine amidase [Clostridia bacterium]|nr:N-acetylmuramoyl-L-alanine amidase [Clostridia bacterium]